MSVKSILEKTRRSRTPVLPTSAVVAYVLVGAERLCMTFFVVTWPVQFDPRTYHAYRDFFLNGTPETLMWIHVLLVVFLWSSWRGWLAARPLSARPRDARSVRSAALAFLVPALVLAMFSWAYFRMKLPQKPYTIEKIIEFDYSAPAEPAPKEPDG